MAYALATIAILMFLLVIFLLNSMVPRIVSALAVLGV